MPPRVAGPTGSISVVDARATPPTIHTYVYPPTNSYSEQKNCTKAAPPVEYRVFPFNSQGKKALKAQRRDAQGQCMVAPPAPDPDAGYVPIGTGQRCKEAILTDLRRRLQEDHRRGLRVGPNPTYPTADECYEYCSLTLQYQVGSRVKQRRCMSVWIERSMESVYARAGAHSRLRPNTPHI